MAVILAEESLSVSNPQPHRVLSGGAGMIFLLSVTHAHTHFSLFSPYHSFSRFLLNHSPTPCSGVCRAFCWAREVVFNPLCFANSNPVGFAGGGGRLKKVLPSVASLHSLLLLLLSSSRCCYYCKLVEEAVPLWCCCWSC